MLTALGHDIIETSPSVREFGTLAQVLLMFMHTHYTHTARRMAVSQGEQTGLIASSLSWRLWGKRGGTLAVVPTYQHNDTATLSLPQTE